MGKTESRNLEEQRREHGGIVYYDRGDVTGRDGQRYSRFAVQTHFVEVGEDQAELVRKYILPLFQPGDVLAFGAKVMAMCTGNVRTKGQEKPGFWARLLSPHASETTAGIGMHDPYKLQLAIDMVGAPKVIFAAIASAVTKPFGKKGVFYKIVGPGVAGIDGFYYRSSFKRCDLCSNEVAGRILETRVEIAFSLEVEQLSHMLRRFIAKRCRLDNRHLTRLAVARFISGANAFCSEFHPFLLSNCYRTK